MLGFKKQLVFATHSVTTPFSMSRKLGDDLRYGTARAHNRAMSDFVANDARLMGVGVVPLNNPELAVAELEFALIAGMEAIWVPHYAPRNMSPGHVVFYPFGSASPNRKRLSSCMSAAHRYSSTRSGPTQVEPPFVTGWVAVRMCGAKTWP